MTRSFATLAFVVALSASPALAHADSGPLYSSFLCRYCGICPGDNDPGGTVAVPELDADGATAAGTLLLGGALILAGRRRRRDS